LFDSRINTNGHGKTVKLSMMTQIAGKSWILRFRRMDYHRPLCGAQLHGPDLKSFQPAPWSLDVHNYSPTLEASLDRKEDTNTTSFPPSLIAAPKTRFLGTNDRSTASSWAL